MASETPSLPSETPKEPSEVVIPLDEDTAYDTESVVGNSGYEKTEPGGHARQAAGQVSPSGRDRTLSQSVRPAPHVQSAVSPVTAVVGGA